MATERELHRRAITLLEVLVGLALLALMVGLLLPAVQRVRLAAAALTSNNHLKQIGLATQNFAAQHDSRLPALRPLFAPPGDPLGETVFVALLPYLEQSGVYENLRRKPLVFGPDGIDAGTPADQISSELRCLLDPTDPTVGRVTGDSPATAAFSTYAANALIFCPYSALPSSLPDGTSSTILFTTHYAKDCAGRQFKYAMYRGADTPDRIASFADGFGWVLGPLAWGDYGPITTGEPPVSRAYGNVSFQVAPRPADCDPRLPQATTTAGLRVALADGSVRVLRPGIEPSLFWGAVTPAAGEVVGID